MIKKKEYIIKYQDATTTRFIYPIDEIIDIDFSGNLLLQAKVEQYNPLVLVPTGLSIDGYGNPVEINEKEFRYYENQF